MGMGAGMMGGGMALGGALSLAGAFMGADAADEARDEMRRIANTPGINIGSIYDDSFGNIDKYRLRSQGIAQANNNFNQAELNRTMEAQHPGWNAMQAKLMANNLSMANGMIPQDVQDRLYQSAAGRALEGGYGGSGMARNLTARDFGRTSMDLQQQALMNTPTILAGQPILKQDYIQNYQMGPQQMQGIRSAERAQSMGLNAQAAGMPSGGAVWGNMLMSNGAALSGGSFTGLASMGGGGGGGGSPIGGAGPVGYGNSAYTGSWGN